MSEQPERPPVDVDAFCDMAVECGWTVAEFTSFYVSGTRRQLDALEAAWQRFDVGEVARLAHGARGSSATAGVPGMAAAFGVLERAASDGRAAEVSVVLPQLGTMLDAVTAMLHQADARQSSD